MRSTLGENWWERTHYRVGDMNRLKSKVEKGSKEAMKEKLKMEENNEVLNRMGWLKYTFMPWERNKVRMQIMKIQNLVAQMEEEEYQEEREENQYSKKSRIKAQGDTSAIRRNQKESKLGAYAVKR